MVVIVVRGPVVLNRGPNLVVSQEPSMPLSRVLIAIFLMAMTLLIPQPRSFAGDPETGQAAASASDTEATPDAGEAPQDGKTPGPEVMAALQAGPKALSLAFRVAAKRATPSVVVLYAYGQDSDSTESGQEESPEEQLPL